MATPCHTQNLSQVDGYLLLRETHQQTSLTGRRSFVKIPKDGLGTCAAVYTAGPSPSASARVFDIIYT